MKRAFELSNKDATGPSFKQMRTTTNYDALFNPDLEIDWSDLALYNTIPEDKYIVGVIAMVWPRKPWLRVLLELQTKKLEITFIGPGTDKLDIMYRDVIRLALRGAARKERMETSQNDYLPFRLAFEAGAIIQLLPSQRRTEGKIVDLFREAESMRTVPEDEWFLDIPSAGEPPNLPPETDASPETTSIGKPPEAVLFDTYIRPEALQRTISTSPISTSKPNVKHIITDIDVLTTVPPSPISVEPLLLSLSGPATPPISESQSVQQLSSLLQPQARTQTTLPQPQSEFQPTLPQPQNELQTTLPQSQATQTALPQRKFQAQLHIVQPQAQARPLTSLSLAQLQTHRKERRLKKRDTRYKLKSNKSDVSNVVAINTNNSLVPDELKPLGKKAAKRRQVQLAQEAAAATKARLSSPSPPPHDPALDLTAGFISERAGVFAALGNVNTGKMYSLVGVVTDVGPVKTTRTGERSKSFIIVDPSQNNHGLTIVVFMASDEEELLPSATVGQVLLLQNVFIQKFNDKLQGVCYKDQARWCGYDPLKGKHFYSQIVPHSRSPPLRSNAFFKIGPTELAYLVKMSDWWRALQESRQISTAANSMGGTNVYITIPQSRRLSDKLQKNKIIAEIQPGTYVDCVVEVLKIGDMDDRKADIFVTDYSENSLLGIFPEIENLPMGQRTLKVSLWEAAKDMAPEIECGKFYLLENMRVKYVYGRLEGNAGGYGLQGLWRLKSDSKQKGLAELIDRKVEYERNPEFSILTPEIVPQKTNEDPKILSPIHQTHSTKALTQHDVVKCLHMDQKLDPVSYVQRCELYPNKFRIRCRITEYYPCDISNFVRVVCNSCRKKIGRQYIRCPECGDLTEASVSASYRFALRVVDQSGAEINMCVSGEEANEFMAGLPALEAREDIQTLTKRLTPLLGHLMPYHESLDEQRKVGPGPWVDFCVMSWQPNTSIMTEASGVEERGYKLFGCYLMAANDL